MCATTTVVMTTIAARFSTNPAFRMSRECTCPVDVAIAPTPGIAVTVQAAFDASSEPKYRSKSARSAPSVTPSRLMLAALTNEPNTGCSAFRFGNHRLRTDLALIELGEPCWFCTRCAYERERLHGTLQGLRVQPHRSVGRSDRRGVASARNRDSIRPMVDQTRRQCQDVVVRFGIVKYRAPTLPAESPDRKRWSFRHHRDRRSAFPTRPVGSPGRRLRRCRRD